MNSLIRQTFFYALENQQSNVVKQVPMQNEKQEEEEKKKNQSRSENVEEHDEEFEKNFLRAVDRALGVVNKQEKNLIQSNDEQIPVKTEQTTNFDLARMTEQALSSLNNSPLFSVKSIQLKGNKFSLISFF